MQRRSFLGTVIGTLVASRLDYKALLRDPTDRMSASEQMSLAPQLWDADEEWLMRWRGFFVLGDSDEIKGTPLLGVDRTSNNIVFKFDDWWAAQSGIHVIAAGLITPSGKEFRRSRVYTGSLNVGDCLKAKYTLNRVAHYLDKY